MDQAERRLWMVQNDSQTVQCVMRSCCAGAELQILVMRPSGLTSTVLRELYPCKSDLYERARRLHARYQGEIASHESAEATTPIDRE